MMTKRLFSILLTGSILLALCATVGAQDVSKIKFPKLNKIEVPQVEKVTLDNGMRLYILEDRALPIFNANVRINCGSYLEPADKVGLGSICGEVLRTGGTEKWTGDEIDELLEGVGGSVETSIDRVSGSAYINVLSEYTDMGLEVLADVLRRPVFDEDKIELAKVQARTLISRRNDDPASLARQEYRKLIYGAESPYARHEEYKTIDAITRDDLVAFHKTFFHPENIQIAVWGDFDSEEIVAKLNEWFADWPQGGIPVPPPPKVDYDWRSKVYYAEKPDAKQSYIRMGHIGGMMTDADYTDRIVMNSILGEGFGSRVTDNVRTKLGLAYSTGGRCISNYCYPGYFFILASTKPQSTMQATREMIKQIKSMHTDPPTDQEMQKGKDGYLNSFVFNFDSRREVLTRMMTYDFFGLPEDFLQKEKEGVEAVTPEAVVEAAKNNIRPDEMIILVVGNAADFDEPLEALGLGPVDTIDITIPPPEADVELTITPENLELGKTILGKGVEAAGGIDAIKAVASLEEKGTLTIVMGPQELPVSVHSFEVLPNRHRSEMNFMGRTLYDIRDGDKGWKTDQMTMEVTEMTAEDIKKSDEEYARNLIHIYQTSDEPYYQAVYNGSGEVEGTSVEWVAIVDSEGESICRLGFDSEKSHVVCRSYVGESPMGEGLLEETYSDFQEAGGVILPMKAVIKMNDQKVLQSEYTERIVNGDIPEDAFTKPE